MARQVIGLSLLFSFLSSGLCGDVTVMHSPDSLRFGSAGAIRATDLDDVLAASLGYTPIQSSPWHGLTVTSPFASPRAAVVVEVRGGEANVRLEGATYGLKEDTDMAQAFHRLKNIYGTRAQRHTVFKHVTLDSEPGDERSHYTIPETTVLNISREPDTSFLREMASLVSTAEDVGSLSSTSHGGQDVFFLESDTLEQLVKVYGLQSPQVKEAIEVVRDQLVKVADVMRRRYEDDVLVVAAVSNNPFTLTRKTRSILQSSETEEDFNQTTTDEPPINDFIFPITIKELNLNAEYSSDYPAIFNIVLWLSIILFIAVLATSIAMATMDPGRDSIIYRMTTMRMKKDN